MKDKKGTEIQENEDSRFPGQKQNESGLERAISYAKENNRKIITIVSVLAIAIAAVIFVYRTMEEGRKADKEEASIALSRIMDKYLAGDYKNALYADSIGQSFITEPIIGLEEIADKYEGSAEAYQAALFAGRAHLELKNYDKAEDYFETAGESETPHVQMGALAGLAVLLEYKNENSAAAEKWEEAAALAKEENTKGKYSFYAAFNYEQSGDKEKAEKIYRDIVNAQETEFVGEARAALARMGKSFE